MISSWVSERLSRRDIHYGWIMVAVTFFALLVSAGSVGAPGVFILPLEKEFGWTTTQVSAALSIRLVLYGLMAPFAAALMERFGLRNIAVAALTIIAAGLLLSLRMTQAWHLILCWGFIVGFGTGLTAMVFGATVATRWFSERRGLVIGIFAASMATGQLIFLPLLAYVTDVVGWRAAIAIMCVLLLISTLAVILLMRDRPSDLGLLPFGQTGSVPLAPAPSAPVIANVFGVLRDASRTWVFWVLFGSFFICGTSTNGLIQTHFIPMCADFGLPATTSAGLLAAMGVLDFFGTIASGWLSDRYDNRWLLLWYYGLRGLSLVFLPFTDFSLYGLSLFAVFYGLDWIATVPPTVKLTAKNFGPERAGIVFGWVFVGHQLGAAFAAFAAGLTRTTFATYLPAFFAAGVLCLIAAAVMLTIRNNPPAATPVPAAG
jgi:MFS family permease